MLPLSPSRQPLHLYEQWPEQQASEGWPVQTKRKRAEGTIGKGLLKQGPGIRK